MAVATMPTVVMGMLGVMRMRVEPTDQEEGQHQSANHPPHTPVNSGSAILRDHDRVRQLVKQADTKHQTADDTQQHLHATVSKPHDGGNESTRQGCPHHNSTINRQQSRQHSDSPAPQVAARPSRPEPTSRSRRCPVEPRANSRRLATTIESLAAAHNSRRPARRDLPTRSPGSPRYPEVRNDDC